MPPSRLTADQCRAARALVSWTRGDLSTQSLVAVSTLADFEAGKREPHPRTLAAIQQALEGAGVLFYPADAQAGPGVRLMAKD